MKLGLVPGWAMSGDLFAPLQALLSHPSESLDLPGFGSRAGETCPTRLDALAQALRHHTRPGPLLGWSLGGMACLQLALTQPQSITGLILLCSTPRFVAGADWPFGAELTNFRAFREAFRGDWQSNLRRFLLMQAGKTSADRQQLAQTIAQLQCSVPEPAAASLDNGLEILAHADLRQQLGQLQMPVLVVSGRRDRICHPGASRWMAQQLAHGRLLELDSGHAPQLSHSRELAREINAFLQEIGR